MFIQMSFTNICFLRDWWRDREHLPKANFPSKSYLTVSKLNVINALQGEMRTYFKWGLQVSATLHLESRHTLGVGEKLFNEFNREKHFN